MITADKPTGSDGQYVDGVSYYAHVTDLRSTTYGNDLTGTQNITFYAVYAFGDETGTKTLQSMAKYGGFESKNGDDKGTAPNKYPSPDQASEWDKDGNSVPDTYFKANDGTVLESNIAAAMSSILAKVASGTAASILSNSEGSGANLLQAVFYPNKIFSPPTTNDTATSADWIGEMQNLWYYVDPFIANSTVREDTDFSSTTPNHVLNLKNDYAARFFFTESETKVELKRDTNGDGLGDSLITASEDPDLVKSLWRAGRQLWARSADDRRIHTSVDGYSLLTPTTTVKGGFYAPSTGDTNVTGLKSYLQAADATAAKQIIDYIRGTDQTYRPRRVSLLQGGSTVTNEWKLGDIVASTPRLQSTNRLNAYNLESPAGYADKSYNAFVTSSNYKNRGMVYVGANDGMLHAFKLGKLTVRGVTDVTGVTISGDIKATLTGENLGEEQWAYVPRSALPYLKYFTDAQNYKHLYYVDGPTVLADVAIANPTYFNADGTTASCTGEYSICDNGKTDNKTRGTNWKTVLIGSMGLGGASKLKSSTCIPNLSGTCVKTPIFDPTDTATTKTRGVGYSSYFALDISGQYFDSSGTLVNQPTLKWEFPPADAAGDIGLGYATSGAAIVRVGDKTKNGKWFAVFASGPTGPIDTGMHRFMGRSDQNLKIFVVDLGATGTLVKNTAAAGAPPNGNYWVIDTLIPRAFAGNIVSSVIDTDRWDKSADGNYQDDALYIGYTNSKTVSGVEEWTDGGVIRLLTKEDANPANWSFSKVIEGVGPVTSGITKLQDRKNKKLWLYFGTGRFFFSGDDSTNARYIMGVQDLCYTASNKMNKICTVTDAPVLGISDTDLKQQNTIGAMGSEKGWKIQLDPEASSTGAERTITDPVALTNGLVLFTTFKPTANVCEFGGSSYVWGVNYSSGGTPAASTTTGKILVQVSTGEFKEIFLSSALTAMDGRKMGTAMTGKPPSDPPPVVSNAGNKPAKKIMHLQEK
jgi:type IV pilus assembly protein PilY1